jgi:small subunit ribosomal protein S20
MRLAASQRLRNRQHKSTIRTLFGNLQQCVEEQDGEGAAAVAAKLTSRIDKAVSKGILHKNNAAHKKSRVTRILATLS